MSAVQGRNVIGVGAALGLVLLGLCLVVRETEPAAGATCDESEVKIGIVLAKGCFLRGSDPGGDEYLAYVGGSEPLVINGFSITDGGEGMRFYTGDSKDGKGASAPRVTSNGKTITVSVTDHVPSGGSQTFTWTVPNGLDLTPPAKGTTALFEASLNQGLVYNLIPPLNTKELVEINEKGGGSFELHVGLKSFVQLLEKDVDFALDFDVGEDGSVTFEGIEGELEGVPIGTMLEISELALKLVTHPEFSLDATAGVTLKMPERFAGYGLTATFGLNQHGPTKFGVAGTGLNLQLGTSPIYLQKAGLTFVFQPGGAEGDLGLTAGPKLDLLGKELAAFALDGSVQIRGRDEKTKKPGFLETRAAAKVLNLPVGNAHFRYDFGQGTEFDAEVGMGIPSLTNDPSQPFYVGAHLGGWTTASHFNLEGWGRLKIFAFNLAGTRTVLSDVGAAGCVQLVAWIGGGVRWRDGHISLLGGWSCDIGAYRAPRSARSAVARLSGRVERSQTPLQIPKEVKVVSVVGSDAPPLVQLQHADGRVLETPDVGDPDGVVELDHGAAIAEHGGGDAVHFLPRRSGGSWVLSSSDGSPLDVEAIRMAKKLPDHEVEAKLVGKGLRRTLVWSARKIPHQSLVFSEVLPNGSEAGLFRTGRAKGRRQVKLAHAGGYGKRKLAVDVRQRYDTPRDSLVADGYRVERPTRPEKPSRVRADRLLHDVIVKWRGVEGARGYRVVLRDPSGLRTARSVGSRVRKLRLDSVPTRRRLNVSVFAHNVDGIEGRPGRTSIDTHGLVGGPRQALRHMLRDARQRSGSRRVITHPECPGRSSCRFALRLRRGKRVLGRGVLHVGPDMTDRLSFAARRPAKATLHGKLLYRGDVYRAASRPR